MRTPSPTARIGRIEICPELFLDLLLNPADLDTELPEDIKPLRLAINDVGNIVLIVESQEFDEIYLSNSRIPYIPLMYKTKEELKAEARHGC